MNSPKRVAILGVGKIGKYHAREFAAAGCTIVAILCSTQESARKKATLLKEEFGLTVKPYHILEELLTNEQLDAASICTPLKEHGTQVATCLAAGLSVLCEKPFVESASEAEELIRIARKNQVEISVNTQWLTILEQLHLPEEIKEFTMYMEPGMHGKELVLDGIPHMISLLVRLVPDGSVEDLHYLKKTNTHAILSFKYGSCKVTFEFTYKEERPREVYFTINGTTYRRDPNKLGPNYEQYLDVGDKTIEIPDPLRSSIRRFVASLNRETPLLTAKEIVRQVAVQEELLTDY